MNEHDAFCTLPTVNGELKLKPDEVAGFETILQAVANEWRVQVEQIMDRCRLGEVAFARQMAMVICRKYLFVSNAETARRFDRTAATVIHAMKMWQGDMETNMGYAARYNRIIKSFKE